MAEEVIPNTRECLTTLVQRFPEATVVMETGTHSPWVSRHLEAQGHRVVVANARKMLVARPPMRAPALLTLCYAPGHA